MFNGATAEKLPEIAKNFWSRVSLLAARIEDTNSFYQVVGETLIAPFSDKLSQSQKPSYTPDEATYLLIKYPDLTFCDGIIEFAKDKLDDKERMVLLKSLIKHTEVTELGFSRESGFVFSYIPRLIERLKSKDYDGLTPIEETFSQFFTSVSVQKIEQERGDKHKKKEISADTVLELTDDFLKQYINLIFDTITDKNVVMSTIAQIFLNIKSELRNKPLSETQLNSAYLSCFSFIILGPLQNRISDYCIHLPFKNSLHPSITEDERTKFVCNVNSKVLLIFNSIISGNTVKLQTTLPFSQSETDYLELLGSKFKFYLDEWENYFSGQESCKTELTKGMQSIIEGTLNQNEQKEIKSPRPPVHRRAPAMEKLVETSLINQSPSRKKSHSVSEARSINSRHSVVAFNTSLVFLPKSKDSIYDAVVTELSELSSPKSTKEEKKSSPTTPTRKSQ